MLALGGITLDRFILMGNVVYIDYVLLLCYHILFVLIDCVA